MAPDALRTAFAETNGVIYGTTATFGAPSYGKVVIGRLLYGESKGHNHCDAEDYDLPAPTEETISGVVNVVLVRRGGCTFVTKVRVAEQKNAHAVVVVDKESSSLTSEQISHITMSDDGLGSSIKIPSILITRVEGQKLIDAAKLGLVVVELAWNIPRGEVVVADFWMSSGSRESGEFLERFKDCAEVLRFHFQFVPHYHVFSLPPGKAYGHLCADKDSKYCAPDPDGPGPITGGDVAMEDLRQLCIWNVTAQAHLLQGQGATFSQQFWEYVVLFQQECPVDSSDEDELHRFSERCSLRVMDLVGIPRDLVYSCTKKNQVEFMEDQIRNVAWSPLALRLNGWRYSGPLDPEAVLKAVCSGYASQPPECDALLSGYAPYAAGRRTLSFGVFMGTIVCMGCALAFVVLLYKRHVTSSARQILREEVMLEVQSQMDDYVPMQDLGLSSDKSGGTPRRTLAF